MGFPGADSSRGRTCSTPLTYFLLPALTGASLYPDFWRVLGNDAKHPLGERPLWISHYDVQHPLIPNAWAQAGFTFWQYDGNGGRRFPGGIDADFDIFNGSEDQLRQFLVACVPPPGPARSPSPPAAK